MVRHMPLLKITRDIDPALEKKLLNKNHKLRKDFLWIFGNEQELRKKYSNKYIAVKNKKVVFANDTMEKLMNQINSAHKRVFDYAIHYITEKPSNFLF